MSALLRFWGIFVVAVKRMIAQRGLALATSVGVIAAVALTMSIPIYSDAVYQDILQTELSRVQTGGELQQARPPYAFMFRYVGAWSDPVPVDRFAPVDQYLSGPVISDLGLPEKLFVRYLKTDTFRLFPSGTVNYDNSNAPMDWVSLATANHLDEHITLVEGSMPADSTSSDVNTPVDILINEARATKFGMQVGETYIIYTNIKSDQGQNAVQFPVRVAGVWKFNDEADPYWFYSRSEFQNVLFVSENTLMNRVTPDLGNSVYLAVWYWVLNGSHVHSGDVSSVLGRITNVTQKTINLLPDTRLDVSPVEMLIRYQNSSSSLTVFLYAFSIPLLFMLLTFITLVVDMMVSQRRNEIAVLRSRGATVLQIVGMAVLESLLLGLVGMLAGSPMSLLVAQFFGKARSFLNFSSASTLHPVITLLALRYGFVAVCVTLMAQVIPTLGAARYTVVSYKAERARQLRPPFWQRAWLDVLLFIPAGYGAYLLRQQSKVIPVVGGHIAADPFQNPLLLLVPALGIFSLTLFMLRILPLLMAFISWVTSKTKSVGVLLASRYLSRQASGYNAPLILLVLTLSLSTFTATMAQTLDKHLHDQTYYKVGGDVSVAEMGEFTGAGAAFNNIPAAGGAPDTSSPTDTTTEASTGNWVFLPVSEHLKVPGVKAATRVNSTNLLLNANGVSVGVVYKGIDRLDFPQVAFWRRDFASPSLGSLMNDLARTSEGVLVSRDMMNAYGLKIGDLLQGTTYSLEQPARVEFKIVGVVNYFPTWYPADGPLVVGNLDNFFEQAGGQFPYDVWLKLKPNANLDQMNNGIETLYKRILYTDVSSQIIAKEQRRPERQGFFGMLSVGFTALAFLTVLGFLLYALFSFRRRFVELGMLRAIGLSARQMFVFLAAELAFIFLVGLGAGTGLGVWVSNLFIPYLQMGTDSSARIPPYVVQIDWGSVFQIYILFGLLFVGALAILTYMLMRMKIFQAIKLGEAV